MNENPIQSQPSCDDPESIYGSLTVNDAIRQILDSVNIVAGYQKVPTIKTVARVLDEIITSELNVPAHTNAAVDGYALNAESLPSPGNTTKIPIKGRALAGKPYDRILEHNVCIRIMTGAEIPGAADTVIMQEHVQLDGDYIHIDARHTIGQNIRRAGEDIKKGSVVLRPGQFFTPADVGLVASLGIGEVKVKRKPRVAIFSTGDEIHDIGNVLASGGIFDSNRFTLASALQRMAIDIIDLGIISDEKASLHNALCEIASDVDMIITSGGVSVGEADYVKEVLANMGAVEFWKVAIKPGRPIAFGKVKDAIFFGLPGNPVAVMVTFYQFVLPALRKLMGIKNAPAAPKFKARSTGRIRKLPGRTEFQRGILEQDEDGEWWVRTTGKQGAGILTSISLANCFIILPHDGKSVESGNYATVQPFAGLMSL